MGIYALSNSYLNLCGLKPILFLSLQGFDYLQLEAIPKAGGDGQTTLTIDGALKTADSRSVVAAPAQKPSQTDASIRKLHLVESKSVEHNSTRLKKLEGITPLKTRVALHHKPEMVQPSKPEMIQPVEPEMIQPVEPEMIQPVEPQIIQPVDPEIVHPFEADVRLTAQSMSDFSNRQKLLGALKAVEPPQQKTVESLPKLEAKSCQIQPTVAAVETIPTAAVVEQPIPVFEQPKSAVEQPNPVVSATKVS